MSPLQEKRKISLDTWEDLSASKPRRGGPKPKNLYPQEDDAIKRAKNNGEAFRLTYDDQTEAEMMQARLKERAGDGVRVLTHKNKPNSIFVGPDDQ